MTRKKTATPARRKRAPAKGKARSGTSRTLKGFIAAALAAFGIGSVALNTQWLDALPLDRLLAELGLSLPSSQAPAPAPPAAPPVQGYTQTRFADCPQFFPSASRPVVPAAPTLRELCFTAFAILHSGQTKTPVFVAERLNRRMLEAAKGVPRTDRFFADARLPAAERAELNDYRGSGYSRGHMAPAGNMATPEAMAQSFSLANMVPQDQRQNAGPWSRIEEDTRQYAMRASGDIYIFTGPVYAQRPETIGPGKVAVPSHVFKLVHDPATGRSWAHWQQNSPDAQAGAPISYEELVRRTGLKLLP